MVRIKKGRAKKRVNLGARVRQMRVEMGWTQQKLADKAGVASSYISRLEGDGFKAPSADVLLHLAEALKADVNELYQATGYSNGIVSSNRVRPLAAILREAQERCESLEVIEVPIRCKVPTSYPLEEETNSYIFIPKEVLSMARGKVIAYQAISDYLVPEGILPKDYLLVDAEAPFVDGRIYVIRVGDRVVVARTYFVESKLRLMLPSGEYEERNITEVDIWGRVIVTGHWKSL